MVGKEKMLWKVDLLTMFQQLEVAVEDKDKTCLVSPFGKYRFMRMILGWQMLN